MQQCNTNIMEAIKLSERMLSLSETGISSSEDDGCILLYGVIQDCAYKIRKEAEREMKSHVDNHKWK